MATVIQKIVYPRPNAFEARRTSVIVAELDALSRNLVEGGHSYLPIGFGRQGSSDPWFGAPVDWRQISGARVVVEATLSEIYYSDLNQGSHFSHNMISFKVLYLSVRHTDSQCIDWYRLNKHETVNEARFRLRLVSHLLIEIQGRTGRGVIRYG